MEESKKELLEKEKLPAIEVVTEEHRELFRKRFERLMEEHWHFIASAIR